MTITLSSKLQLTKLSDEVEGDGYAFEAVILSGEPIDTWHRFVIDLSAITPHKPRLTVDYNHNDELIIGYGENFHFTPEGLKSTGKLTAGTYADEIVKLAKAGVPFEASAVVDLTNANEMTVGADSSVVVNGRTYQGPISVYTNVSLEGYSICPHGADKFTTFTLLSKEINFMTKTKEPPKGKTLLSDGAVTTGESQETTVKNQELDDFCKMFGDTNGLALFQSGADIAEAKQWQALNEKYSKYLADTEDEEETSPSEPAKENEEMKLSSATPVGLDSSVLSKLEMLAAAVTKLQAAMPPRGAEPVSHGQEQTKLSNEPKTSASRYASKIRQQGIAEP